MWHNDSSLCHHQFKNPHCHLLNTESVIQVKGNGMEKPYMCDGDASDEKPKCQSLACSNGGS